MGTRQGNKVTSDVAADSISQDSLSFTGLVSIQDQEPKLPSPNHYQLSKRDPEFEFTSSKTNSNSAVNPIKITPADLLISNGQLQPRALAFQTNQASITNPRSSLRTLLAAHSKKSSFGQSSRARKYHEQLDKASNRTIKKSTETRTWFGQKMKSFLSPCQDCRAIKPDPIEVQTVPGENFKIY